MSKYHGAELTGDAAAARLRERIQAIGTTWNALLLSHTAMGRTLRLALTEKETTDYDLANALSEAIAKANEETWEL